MTPDKTPSGDELPDEYSDNQSDDSHEDEGHLIEEHLDDSSGGRRRRKKRIKVRKRVRIKRKSSPKKKARKVLEKVAWILLIAAFIITLLVLVLQLDLSSKHRKKSSGMLTIPVTKYLINNHRLA